MKRLNPATLFDSQDLSKDLARKSVRGGMTTLGSQGVKFVLQVVGTAILARLASPRSARSYWPSPICSIGRRAAVGSEQMTQANSRTVRQSDRNYRQTVTTVGLSDRYRGYDESGSWRK